VVVTSPAHADPSAADKETSRDLYAEGVKALEVGDFGHAERACGGAFRLVRAPTGAACWGHALEGLGKLVEARDAYLAAVHLPQQSGEPAVFANARADGQAGADRLATRIATLVFSVVGPSDGTPLRVAIDGMEIAPETARLPRKVNPGNHVVLVTSKGYRTARVEVTAVEGQARRVEVQLLRAPADESTQQEAGAVRWRWPSAPSPIAWAALGVGGVGLVVGSVFGVMALNDGSNLDKQTGCPKACPNTALSQIGTLHRDQWVSDIGLLGVGVVGFAVGGALLLTSHGPDAAPAAVGLDIGPGIVRVRGRF
jgi:hypothetical protein